MPMSKFTFEDYRNAIKAKYEEEIEGEYANNLISPTTANLRNLCIKRFMSNNNKDDLNTFESFFEFPFDKDKKNLFGDDEMNKLEAVKRFLLGRTERPAEDTIQLAAILVDLQPRPFSEFRKQIDEEDSKLIEDLRNNKSSREVSSEEMSDSIEIDSSNDPEPTADDQESEASQIPDSEPTEIHNEDDKPKSKKMRYAAIIAILMGLGLIIYLALPKKECMQWSNDHYEMVDCDLKVNSLGIMPPVELLDESLINLKKVQVCDTTSCFDKNGDAIIWYAKSENGVDFFNGHGRHPENNRPLKPVTKYIISKYVKK